MEQYKRSDWKARCQWGEGKVLQNDFTGERDKADEHTWRIRCILGQPGQLQLSQGFVKPSEEEGNEKQLNKEKRRKWRLSKSHPEINFPGKGMGHGELQVVRFSARENVWRLYCRVYISVQRSQKERGCQSSHCLCSWQNKLYRSRKPSQCPVQSRHWRRAAGAICVHTEFASCSQCWNISIQHHKSYCCVRKQCREYKQGATRR